MITARELWDNRVANYGWGLEHTGGGCTALTHYLEDGRILVATTKDDPSHPEYTDNPARCSVGLYDADWDQQFGILHEQPTHALGYVTPREWIARILHSEI